jgi:hypothetical protein
MPFIVNYKGAMHVLEDMESGKCKGSCRSVWRRNIKHALKTKSNPLKLTRKERKSLNLKLRSLSKTRRSRNSSKETQKRGWNIFGL